MDFFSALILVIVIAGFAATFWFLNKRLQKPKEDNQSMLMLAKYSLRKMLQTV